MVAVLCALAMAMTPQAKEVEFEGVGGFKLKGTLQMPAGSTAPARALLLIPGSGPTDRNGNQPPALVTDLLKETAEHLAKNGIATLRFDKRAAHVYAADWPKDPSVINDFFSWQNFVGDAIAAYRFLGKQEGIDAKRVGVLGHSEGGLIALQMGNDLPSPDKPYTLILAGTNGRNMADVVREQLSNLLKNQGANQAVHDEYMGHIERSITQIKQHGTVPEDIPAGLKPLFNPSVAGLLRSYFEADPPALAKAFPGPVLVLNGQFDAQISAERDLPILVAALKARPAGKVESAVITEASHNFKKAENLKAQGFAGPVLEPFLSLVTEWMKGLG